MQDVDATQSALPVFVMPFSPHVSCVHAAAAHVPATIIAKPMRAFLSAPIRKHGEKIARWMKSVTVETVRRALITILNAGIHQKLAVLTARTVLATNTAILQVPNRTVLRRKMGRKNVISMLSVRAEIVRRVLITSRNVETPGRVRSNVWRLVCSGRRIG